MLSLIQELFGVLTRSQRRRLLLLQALMVLMALAEVGSVSALGIFMAVVTNEDLLLQASVIASFYRMSGLGTPAEFIQLTGVIALAVLVSTALISMLTTWRASLFATRVGQEIADRLYRYYMHQPWLFHARGSSAELTKKIASESYQVASQVIYPLMMINTRAITILFMIVGLMLVNPWVILMALAIFGCAYYLLYKLVRQRLTANGRRISELATRRYKLMAEGFGGIKDVLLLGRQADFVERFQASGDKLSSSMSVNDTLAMAPKYFMDMIAFGSVIVLVLYLTSNYQGDLAAILPLLAIYALAGFKVLPGFQQIYHAAATIKAATPAFDSIKADLASSHAAARPAAASHAGGSVSCGRQRLMRAAASHAGGSGAPQLPALDQAMVLEHVSFAYPDKPRAALKSVSLRIPANASVGFVGATGSGKSTLVDLVMGLISPDQGDILIDGVRLTPGNIRTWQDRIGLVSQSIFLADASIRENVAFGIPRENIDNRRVREVLALAQLDELVAELPDGIDTRVGERGVQLSGGQRQRIGIARSLYHNPDVLVFDEATSALDGITEKLIMQAIHAFAGKKTLILIAHRFTTIQQCDIIFLLDKGKIVDHGTYQELLARNAQFKAMSASHPD